MSKPSSIPEELIRIKAHKIWKKRQRKGRDSTPESNWSDWNKAKKYLEKRPWEVFLWKLTKTLSKRPIRRFTNWWETTPIEHFLEDVEFLFQQSALLSIINLVAGITIIISLITWLATEKQRRNAEVYQAWQVITAAYEQSGSGGRREALEFLHSEPRRFPLFWLKWERQSLAGLAAPKAYLVKIKLPQADLKLANLQEAWLNEANLQGAFLAFASLQGAFLHKANLQEANLGKANLQEAWLDWANLQGAHLWGANLQKAFLHEANLQGAFLYGTNLQEADLKLANLQKAVLHEANLQEADLKLANLQGAFLNEVKNLTFEQIKSTCFWDKAIYIGEWSFEKKPWVAIELNNINFVEDLKWVAIEPDNTNFIEKLKNDTASDPEETVDCSRWSR